MPQLQLVKAVGLFLVCLFFKIVICKVGIIGGGVRCCIVCIVKKKKKKSVHSVEILDVYLNLQPGL